MSPQAGWILQEEIVPRLRSAIPRNVNQVGSEDAEELIQDSIPSINGRALSRRARTNPPIATQMRSATRTFGSAGGLSCRMLSRQPHKRDVICNAAHCRIPLGRESPAIVGGRAPCVASGRGIFPMS